MKVADIQKSNASAIGTPTRGQSKKRFTGTEKRVIALETKLKKLMMRKKDELTRPKNLGNAPHIFRRNWMSLSAVLRRSRRKRL